MPWPIRFREKLESGLEGTIDLLQGLYLTWWIIQECPWGSALVAERMLSQGIIGVAADIWIVITAPHSSSCPFMVVHTHTHKPLNCPKQPALASTAFWLPRTKQSAIVGIPLSVKGPSGCWSWIKWVLIWTRVWCESVRWAPFVWRSHRHPSCSFLRTVFPSHAPSSVLLHRYVLPESMHVDANNTTNQIQQPAKRCYSTTRMSYSSNGIYWSNILAT